MWEGHGFFGGGLMWLFWIVLIVLVVWGLSSMAGGAAPRSSGGDGKTALDILKERYARGEIDRDEFEQKKRDLM